MTSERWNNSGVARRVLRDSYSGKLILASQVLTDLEIP